MLGSGLTRRGKVGLRGVIRKEMEAWNLNRVDVCLVLEKPGHVVGQSEDEDRQNVITGSHVESARREENDFNQTLFLTQGFCNNK